MGFSISGVSNPATNTVVVGGNVNVCENYIDILKLAYGASATPTTRTNMGGDTFSDSNGYLNTIDTGNTTALYTTATKDYSNLAYGGAVTETGYTANGVDNAQTNVKGMKILVGSTAVKLVSAAINSQCSDIVTVELRASNATTVLATATIAGSVATFNYALSASTAYYIVNNASSKKQAYRNSVSYPVTGTYVNFTAGYSSSDGGDQSNVAWNFDSISVQPLDTGAAALVQTNSFTIPSTATSYILSLDETLVGTGTVQMKIKFGAGSFSAAKSVDTIYQDLPAGTTSITLQILLNGTGAGNTSTVRGYAFQVM